SGGERCWYTEVSVRRVVCVSPEYGRGMLTRAVAGRCGRESQLRGTVLLWTFGDRRRASRVDVRLDTPRRRRRRQRTGERHPRPCRADDLHVLRRAEPDALVPRTYRRRRVRNRRRDPTEGARDRAAALGIRRRTARRP